jgi:hypothetical protein
VLIEVRIPPNNCGLSKGYSFGDCAELVFEKIAISLLLSVCNSEGVTGK